MGLGKELAGWLRDRATLVALLDKDEKGAPRIHPRRLPQLDGTNPRAVIYHLISDVSENALTEVVKFSTAVLQFDCYGLTATTTDDLREMLKKQLDTLVPGGTVGTLRVSSLEHQGDRDDIDDPMDGSDVARPICSCDYRISYFRPTT